MGDGADDLQAFLLAPILGVVDGFLANLGVVHADGHGLETQVVVIAVGLAELHHVAQEHHVGGSQAEEVLIALGGEVVGGGVGSDEGAAVLLANSLGGEGHAGLIAAHDDIDIFLGDETLGLSDGHGRVALGVAPDHIEGVVAQCATLVDALDGKINAVLHGLAGVGGRASERIQAANGNGLVAFGGGGAVVGGSVGCVVIACACGHGQDQHKD